MSWLEFSANLFTVVSIWLARRNNIQTWWTGIVGSILFAELFREARLYADLKLFARVHWRWELKVRST